MKLTNIEKMVFQIKLIRKKDNIFSQLVQFLINRFDYRNKYISDAALKNKIRKYFLNSNLE